MKRFRLFLFVALFFMTTPLLGQIVITEPMSIFASDTTCVLATDLLNCSQHGVVIFGNNVKFNLNGYKIKGIRALYFGVYLVGNNIEVMNGTIEDFRYGIYAENGNGHKIHDNKLLSNVHNIRLENSDSCRIYKNEINPDGWAGGIGIFLESSFNNEISFNTADKNSIGIYLKKSSGNKILSNSASDNDNSGIILVENCNNNEISLNTIKNNDCGIGIAPTSRNNYGSDNILSHNYVPIFGGTENGNNVTGQLTETVETSKTIYNYELSQNYPNPFNPETEITFNLPGSREITLVIYNSLGQRVANFQGTYPAGKSMIKWNAAQLESGVYYYTLKASEFSETKRMLLLK